MKPSTIKNRDGSFTPAIDGEGENAVWRGKTNEELLCEYRRSISVAQDKLFRTAMNFCEKGYPHKVYHVIKLYREIEETIDKLDSIKI